MELINNPKIKLYLIIGIIVLIIIIAWLINFKNIIQTDKVQNNNLGENWQDLNKKFDTVLINFEEIKHSFKQSTTTTKKIQNTIEITPNQLENIIENLNLSSSTASTTDISLPINK